MSIQLTQALPYLTPTSSAEDTGPVLVPGSSDGPVARAFSNMLNIHYMIDEPGALVFVRERDVVREAREALHARSIDNLRAHLKRRKLRFERGHGGASHIAKLDGHHDASLLLLDELWDPPTRIADLPGEIVAAVPARDVLLFTGSDIPGGVEEVRAAVVRATDRALSPELFVRRDRSWQPFDA